MEEDISEVFTNFQMELENTEIDEKLQCIQKISSVANQIGKESTLKNLIPFLEKHLKVIYYGEDAFPHYAEELLKLAPMIFGNQHADLLFSLYEILADVTDKSVRNNIVQHLISICDLLVGDKFDELVNIIFRLIKHSRFSCRCTGLAVAATIYPKLSSELKEKLRDYYENYTHDDSPIVRSEALKQMQKLAVVLEPEYLPDVAQFLKQTMVDEDMVRVHCIDLMITLASLMDDTEIENKIVPILDFLIKLSWKIRLSIASKLTNIQIALGPKMTRKYFVPHIQKLSHDVDEPVREELASNIVRFSEVLQETYEGEGIDPMIEKELLEIIKTLHGDISPDIVSTLGYTLMNMEHIWGDYGNKKYLLPMILSQIKQTDIKKIDDSLVSNMNKIINMMELNDITGILEKTMFNLQTTPLTKWRARRNLGVTIAKVMKCNVDQYFMKYTFPFFHKLLLDEVCAVRRSMMTIVPLFIKHYGMDWSKEHVLNKIFSFVAHPNYNNRLLVLYCVDEMIHPTLQEEIKSCLASLEPNDLYEILILVCLLKVTIDVTFHEELKEPAEIGVHHEIDLYVENMLEQLQEDSKFLNDKIYLKALLIFLLTFTLKELKVLCTDKIYNVRNRSLRTVQRIKQLQMALKSELGEDWAKNVLENIENKNEIMDKVCNEISGENFEKDDAPFVDRNSHFEKKPDKTAGQNMVDRYVKNVDKVDITEVVDEVENVIATDDLQFDIEAQNLDDIKWHDAYNEEDVIEI